MSELEKAIKIMQDNSRKLVRDFTEAVQSLAHEVANNLRAYEARMSGLDTYEDVRDGSIRASRDIAKGEQFLINAEHASKLSKIPDDNQD